MGVLSYTKNGEEAILDSLGDLAGSPGAGENAARGTLYLAKRTMTGWMISSLNPPVSEFIGQSPVAAEAEEGETLWEQHTPQQSTFTIGLYTRSKTGAFEFIGPLNPVPESEEGPSSAINFTHQFDKPIAATSNYDHIIIEAQISEVYWPFDKTQSNFGSFYEYSGSDNQEPTLVAVVGKKASRELIGLCGSELGGRGTKYNALSSDGETVFFTVFSGCGAPAPASAELYARLHGSLTSPVAASTVDVSACTTSCGAVSGKNFEGASENGEKVFFTSTQKLTDNAIDGTTSGDASEGGGCSITTTEAGGCNLYEYDFGTATGEHLKLVAGGGVLGVSAVARDGSRLYFVSRAAIAGTGENTFGKTPLHEQPNMYVYDTISGRTQFIATLGWEESDWADFAAERPVQVTGAGGRFLLFASAMPVLTPDARGGIEQLFEYDAVTGELVRLTKGENGYNEDGNSVVTGVEGFSIAGRLGGRQDFKTRTNTLNIANNGKSVFFVTQGQLSPRATSAALNCESLYEFHSGGAISQGAVTLISDGTETQLLKSTCGPRSGSVFIDENGANVLFSASDPLVPSDKDGGQRDIYDARIDGGFPLSGSSSCGPGECEGSTSSPPPMLAPESTSDLEEAPLAPVMPVGRPAAKKGDARKLTTALRKCRTRARVRRSACERDARRRFGSKIKAKRSTVMFGKGR